MFPVEAGIVFGECDSIDCLSQILGFGSATVLAVTSPTGCLCKLIAWHLVGSESVKQGTLILD